MALLRLMRITVATVVAATAGASLFLVGCVTGKGGEDSVAAPPMHGDPPAPPPPRPRGHVDSVSPSPNNLLFDQGKSALRPEAKATLDEAVVSLNQHSKDELILTGHASDDGAAEYNLQLGEQRAKKAKAYLVEQGIAPERIIIRSAGEAQPAVPNDSPGHRALNRRVTLQYVYH